MATSLLHDAFEAREPSAAVLVNESRMNRVRWWLRVGAAACFIGHGAFGIITKAGWVPYFGVVGIGSPLAYRLMPVVGTVDIVAGVTMLFSPHPIALLYMVVWATWTALLRPLAGESFFEALERAGNYGVPLALVLMFGRPTTIRGWLQAYSTEALAGSRRRMMHVLQWTTAILLFGHGALEAITRKAIFATQYTAVGIPPGSAPFIGWAEMLVALFVLVRPSVGLLVGIAAWKIATEALYPVTGAPIWEFVERGGSYAAPIALAVLARGTRLTPIVRSLRHT